MEPLLPTTQLAGRACWPETPPRDKRGDLHPLSTAALPTAPCNPNTVLAYDLSDSNFASSWEEREHLPSPLSCLSQLSGPAGPEHRVVLTRPSSWVMLSILEPNLCLFIPKHPWAWGLLMPLSSGRGSHTQLLPSQGLELPKARPAAQPPSWP